jgi:hypothetical protein
VDLVTFEKNAAMVRIAGFIKQAQIFSSVLLNGIGGMLLMLEVWTTYRCSWTACGEEAGPSIRAATSTAIGLNLLITTASGSPIGLMGK